MEHVSDNDRYLFDLMGYVVVPEVLTAAEVAELNALIDEKDLWNAEGAWKNGDKFVTTGSLHEWEEPFRRLLRHPRMLPYLVEFLGPKFRYDHGHALLMHQGGAQLGLHGGGAPFDPACEYVYRDGKIHNGLMVLSYLLTDAPPGAGGFAAVPGSHKANFPCPTWDFDETLPYVKEVSGKAGDVIIFTEAMTHGTWPWKAPYERRNLLYKFTPGHMAWAGPGYPSPSDAADVEYTDTERRMLTGPGFAGREDTYQGG